MLKWIFVIVGVITTIVAKELIWELIGITFIIIPLLFNKRKRGFVKRR